MSNAHLWICRRCRAVNEDAADEGSADFCQVCGAPRFIERRTGASNLLLGVSCAVVWLILGGAGLLGLLLVVAVFAAADGRSKTLPPSLTQPIEDERSAILAVQSTLKGDGRRRLSLTPKTQPNPKGPGLIVHLGRACYLVQYGRVYSVNGIAASSSPDLPFTHDVGVSDLPGRERLIGGSW